MAEKVNKGGRPKKEIDYQKVKELAELFCTQEDISNTLGISTRTLQRDSEFCRIYKEGLNNGKSSLRRKQFKLADRNAAMAIFLGKNYLGQRDVQEFELDNVEGYFKEVVAAISGIDTKAD